MELLRVQDNLKDQISKSKINYKKSPKERLTRSYVESRLEVIEQKWAQFNSNHNEIVKNCDPENLKETKYATDETFEMTEEFYLEFKSELKQKLSSFNACVSDEKVSVDKGSQERSSYSVKLPKISIPTFSGIYTEWVSFRDLFTSLVHNNKTLDNVQKLHYLKTQLTGEAEQLLRHIPITEKNYIPCWNQLIARYNNKQFLSNCILKRFFNQKNIVSESAKAIKELLDVTSDTLNALKNLNIDVSSWDVIIIYIVTLRLDSETRKQWELKVSESVSESDNLPTFDQFKEFLENKFRSLEFLEPKDKYKGCQFVNSNNVKSLHVVNMACPYCDDSHKIVHCQKFANENQDVKRNFVQNKGLCFNCLGFNHSAKYCLTNTTCRVCKRRHHSLLHPKGVSSTINNFGVFDQMVEGRENIATTHEETSQDECQTNLINHFSKGIQQRILLATAIIKAESRNGQNQLLRALLDQGSQASFITEAAVQLLGLNKIPIKGIISGLGGDKSSIVSKSMVITNIKSLHDPEFVLRVRAYVLKSVTSLLPVTKIKISDWFELNEINLADPDYHTPNKIDILLGAEVYGQILKQGLIKHPSGSSVAQNTNLGWVLSGLVETENLSEDNTNHVIGLHTQLCEDEQLKKFWEMESDYSCTSKGILTQEEQLCEELFVSTTQRDENGRYIVRLPFRADMQSQGCVGSRNIAIQRFKYLERKLSNNNELKKQYCNVMQEYIDLDHMRKVSSNNELNTVYLPHHAVIREDKITTKVRVVFDASCKGTNGMSLNNMLMTGPRLQPDLRHIIMRWRNNKICLVSDIVKMYRQIKVAEQDADYQRIIWRENSGEELQDYKHVRVTFGVASAPYLAVRALQQISHDEGRLYPLAAERVLKDFYMDDLLTGCEEVEEGFEIYNQMNNLLKKGGFELQKWSSNSDILLKKINGDLNRNEDEKSITIKLDIISKILGLTWNRQADHFEYTVQLPEISNPVTKRKVISDISRLFDPLGWIAPSIVIAKAFIQKLWIAGLQWDDELPSNLLHDWLTYRNQLTQLKDFRIARWVKRKSDDFLVELHGFCDASNVAYGAVIYMRVIDSEGKIHVNLITAKTKVAPIKQVSIPRLELCGALLLTKLLVEVSDLLGISKCNLHAWTDSEVVLAWLSNHPSKWKTFIGNRVSEIVSVIERSQWSHVQSKDNPADCASRGVNPSLISKHQLWQKGPTWLYSDVISYPKQNVLSTKLEERNVKSHTVTVEDENEDNSMWLKYSTLPKLLRVVAYCRRFLKIKTKMPPHLLKEEINEALTIMIKKCQHDEFKEEIKDIKEGKCIKKKSKLTSFSPFIDAAGILRVGGRIEHAHISEDMKHPILVPHSTHFTNLLVTDAHLRTLHGGPQLMLNYLRSKYWILGARKLVKFHYRRCVKCIRYSVQPRSPLMGQLPIARITANRPFSNSGVDYAGPINIRMSKGRGNRAYKGYICIFVCMATRAIHLEIVSDLTSQGFLAAFKRFVARRGHCSELWSDNGTNFVGAARELAILFNKEKSSIVPEIADCLATNGTKWNFIPPHAPNFGGLWEAGVKSTKHHLKRIVGNSTLTFEEMATVLSQIEACLNSRPLSYISGNRDDSMPLTPGHFLVGEPLVIAPDRNYESFNIGTLKRWQLCQRMVQSFWRRWSNEYLTHFLQRFKWTKQIDEPKVGDVVLVKEDDLPPARWLLGKIVTKHPGLDKVTRVVTLQYKNILVKRPISKLIILPVAD